MNHSRRILRLREDIRHRRVADEGVLVAQSNAEVFVLNELAYRIVELAAEQHEVAAIIAALEIEYEVTRDQLERDVTAFIEEITAIGIADVAEEPAEENAT